MFTWQQHNEIRQVWNCLSIEDKSSANGFYVSPKKDLNDETYTQALLDCMILAGVWPSSIEDNITKAGAEEYEEIMMAQDIMHG